MQNRKPFNLERALAGDPVVTRKGLKVIELKYWEELDKMGHSHPIYVLIENQHSVRAIQKSGHVYTQPDSGYIDDYDLFMATQTTTYYQNVYRYDGVINTGALHRSPQKAKDEKFISGSACIKTIAFDIDDETQKEKKTLWIGVERKTLGDGPRFVTDAHQSKDELIKEYPCSIEDMEIKAIEVEL